MTVLASNTPCSDESTMLLAKTFSKVHPQGGRIARPASNATQDRSTFVAQ